MSFIPRLIASINHVRYGGQPYGKTHAYELRRRLRKAGKKFLNMPDDEGRSPSLPEIFFTLEDVSYSLMDARVTSSQLKPEIGDFQEIIQWLNYESREEVRAGTLLWHDFALENEIHFGVRLLEWGAFYTMLMFNEREAFKWVERQRRAERARI